MSVIHNFDEISQSSELIKQFMNESNDESLKRLLVNKIKKSIYNYNSYYDYYDKNEIAEFTKDYQQSMCYYPIVRKLLQDNNIEIIEKTIDNYCKFKYDFSYFRNDVFDDFVLECILKSSIKYNNKRTFNDCLTKKFNFEYAYKNSSLLNKKNITKMNKMIQIYDIVRKVV